jgi:triosephosphate isomerase
MSFRRSLFAANWKMNTTITEGLALCAGLLEQLQNAQDAEILICPPFTHLVPIHAVLQRTPLHLGAQNMHWEPKGAFTGEVSAGMLQGLATHVILGHSERRQYFGETDADVNRKTAAAIAAGLVPVVCVGETSRQREAAETQTVLARQIRDGLGGLALGAECVVAYEPVWAIGTGVAAHGPQAQEAVSFIRAQLQALVGETADAIRILYGGSASAGNIEEFMLEPDVDGALVGGASLAADSFAALVHAGSTGARKRDSS